ncbi:MAG: hypothetical protein ABL857_01525 [Rickettsiales bacterium]|jgi:hypothetical protein
MDDKNIITEYAANEMRRINERLKGMIESKTPPSDEVRESVIADIEITLSRLQRALSLVKMDDVDTDNNEEEEYNEQ